MITSTGLQSVLNGNRSSHLRCDGRCQFDSESCKTPCRRRGTPAPNWYFIVNKDRVLLFLYVEVPIQSPAKKILLTTIVKCKRQDCLTWRQKTKWWEIKGHGNVFGQRINIHTEDWQRHTLNLLGTQVGGNKSTSGIRRTITGGDKFWYIPGMYM